MQIFLSGLSVLKIQDAPDLKKIEKSLLVFVFRPLSPDTFYVCFSVPDPTARSFEFRYIDIDVTKMN